jgi:hypothetical protein
MYGRRLRDSKTKSGERAQKKESENKESGKGWIEVVFFQWLGLSYIA